MCKEYFTSPIPFFPFSRAEGLRGEGKGKEPTNLPTEKKRNSINSKRLTYY